MDPTPGVVTTAVGTPGLLILVLADPCSINVPLGLEPTAQQSEELRQATPERLSVSGVLGVAMMDHTLPFQCSARGVGPTWNPPAQRSETLTHASEVCGGLTWCGDERPARSHSSVRQPHPRWNYRPPSSPRRSGRLPLRDGRCYRVGVATIDHALPFQCSARVRCIEATGRGNTEYPTAQQSETPMQAIPVNWSYSEALGLLDRNDDPAAGCCWHSRRSLVSHRQAS